MRRQKALTLRDSFCAEIDKATPWGNLHKPTEPFYPRAGGPGRPAIGLARMPVLCTR